MENTNELNYDHGYTSRGHLQTDIDRVAGIMQGYQVSEGKEIHLNSLIDFSLDLEEKLRTENRYERFKQDKLMILDTLVLKHITDDEVQAEYYERDVRKQLSKHKGANRNTLNGWVRQLRKELHARREHII